jgi:hypothetical protein
MNKTIKLLLQSHLKDSERLERVEQRVSVSFALINTSVGVAMNPYIYNTDSYIICHTQA